MTYDKSLLAKSKVLHSSPYAQKSEMNAKTAILLLKSKIAEVIKSHIDRFDAKNLSTRDNGKIDR